MHQTTLKIITEIGATPIRPSTMGLSDLNLFELREKLILGVAKINGLKGELNNGSKNSIARDFFNGHQSGVDSIDAVIQGDDWCRR
jgi:hypothetical protein